MVIHIMSKRERRVLDRTSRRWLLEGIGWVGINSVTGVPAGYVLKVTR